MTCYQNNIKVDWSLFSVLCGWLGSEHQPANNCQRAFSSAWSLIRWMSNQQLLWTPALFLAGRQSKRLSIPLKGDLFSSMAWAVALEECQMMLDPVDTGKDAWALIGLSQSQTLSCGIGVVLRRDWTKRASIFQVFQTTEEQRFFFFFLRR